MQPLNSAPCPPRYTPRWKVRGAQWNFSEAPQVMGVINVTPDSFSDGGQWNDVDAAVEHALNLAGQGAAILDIGGESTRPGAPPVAADEECRRVLPVLERVAARTATAISVDTSKAEVARRALESGACIVNDVSGFTTDPALVDVCAASQCGLIVMHMQGNPRTMQLNPQYADVVGEVRDELSQRTKWLAERGIERERIVLDPGIGFGKTADHNLALLSHLAALHELGRPILIGHSRKRFLQRLLNRPVEERLAGTIGVAIAVAQQGAQIVRVHDVQAVHDALLAWRTIVSQVK